MGRPPLLLKNIPRTKGKTIAFEINPNAITNNKDRNAYACGKYWAARNYLAKKDEEMALKTLGELENNSLSRSAGYSGQDRYYGLAAGAIAIYFAHEKKNPKKAVKFLKSAYEKTSSEDSETEHNNLNAKLAIIEVAAVGGVVFKGFLNEAKNQLEIGGLARAIAEEKTDGVVLYRLPDY